VQLPDLRRGGNARWCIVREDEKASAFVQTVRHIARAGRRRAAQMSMTGLSTTISGAVIQATALCTVAFIVLGSELVLPALAADAFDGRQLGSGGARLVM
jgi:hypothetical protein